MDEAKAVTITDEEQEILEYIDDIENCKELKVRLDMESPEEAESLKQKCHEYFIHIKETLLVCDDSIIRECESKLLSTLSDIKLSEEQVSDANAYDKKLQEETQLLEMKLKDVRNKVEKFDRENREKVKNFKKITEIMCKAFGCTLKPIDTNGGITSFELKFLIGGELVDRAIRLDIDEEAVLIDFDASSFCNELEQAKYKEWYHSTKNMAGLMCKLRTHLVQKSKCQSEN